MTAAPLRISKETFIDLVRRGVDFVLVDAREPEAYATARLKPRDAVRIDPSLLPEQYPALPRERLILTV